MGLPYSPADAGFASSAGLLAIREGEFVCSLLFQDAPPWAVRPWVSTAMIEVSTPRIR